jgi:uncharacterized protein YjbJ (UPF0337 family)
MNTTTIKGHWNVAKGKLKQQYAELTDNDLTYVEGKEDELLGRIQQRTGRAREEIESYLTDECGLSFNRRAAPGETPAATRTSDVRR